MTGTKSALRKRGMPNLIFCLAGELQPFLGDQAGSAHAANAPAPPIRLETEGLVYSPVTEHLSERQARCELSSGLANWSRPGSGLGWASKPADRSIGKLLTVNRAAQTVQSKYLPVLNLSSPPLPSPSLFLPPSRSLSLALTHTPHTQTLSPYTYI